MFALNQNESGLKAEEVSCKMGISEATFYNWKKKYSGLGVSELPRLRHLARIATPVTNYNLTKSASKHVYELYSG